MPFKNSTKMMTMPSTHPKTYDAIAPNRVAFLGLGVMGYPMAAHLLLSGHHVTVYNRTPAKAQAFLAEYGDTGRVQTATTPRLAAEGAEVVFSCVGNDHDLAQVILGDEGALNGMDPHTILVDHTTASAQIARELFEHCIKAGVDFIDAPVSGGQGGAQNGLLTVMCGGETQAFEKIRPLAMAFSRACTLMGESGAGQLTKMVNQICIAGLVQGLGEGIAFGLKAGLDMNLVLDVISKGAAQSWQMENRGKTMVADQFDFGFAVDWMRKDLNIVLQEAQKNGARLPVTALVDQFYADVQQMGGRRWDTSSLIKRLL